MTRIFTLLLISMLYLQILNGQGDGQPKVQHESEKGRAILAEKTAVAKKDLEIDKEIQIIRQFLIDSLEAKSFEEIQALRGDLALLGMEKAKADVEIKRLDKELDIERTENLQLVAKAAKNEILAESLGRNLTLYMKQRDELVAKVDSMATIISDERAAHWKTQQRLFESEKINSDLAIENYQQRRTIHIMKAQVLSSIEKIECYLGEEEWVMDITFNAMISWEDIKDSLDNSFQFLHIQVEPQIKVFGEKNNTVLLLSKDYNPNGYGRIEQIKSHSKVDPHIHLKIALQEAVDEVKDGNEEFKIFRKKKVKYQIPIKINLAKMINKETKEVEMMDVLLHGYILLSNKGKTAKFYRYSDDRMKD